MPGVRKAVEHVLEGRETWCPDPGQASLKRRPRGRIRVGQELGARYRLQVIQ